MLPSIPDTAPFSAEQRAWLNGFFAGLTSVREVDPAAFGMAPEPAPPALPVTVLFGSQTGTAEGLAKQTAKALQASGFKPAVHDLDAVAPADLVGVERLLVITSTYGDGEMPDNAQAFWDALAAADAPRLDGTAYAVLALGDSSYPDFCQAGKALDARLDALGAHHLHARVDCDVEYDEPFATWLDAVQAALRDEAPALSGDGALAMAA